jgi:hypothetical protein
MKCLDLIWCKQQEGFLGDGSRSTFDRRNGSVGMAQSEWLSRNGSVGMALLEGFELGV